MTVVDETRTWGWIRLPEVSILVLVDDGRRRDLLNPVYYLDLKFQSLFLWMTVVDSDVRRSGYCSGFVSILVLVDDGRRQAGDWDRTWPYYAVSILVLVDDGRRRPGSSSSLRGRHSFQSLFLWMTVVDLPRSQS